MAWRRRQPNLAGGRIGAGRAGQPEQFSVKTVLHAQRTQLDHPLRQLAHQGRQALHLTSGHRRFLLQQLEEGFALEHRHEAVLHRHHVGRARLTVQGSEVADDLARPQVAEGDLPAVGTVGGHPHRAIDHEVDVGAALAPQQQRLPGRHTAPAAARRNGIQPCWRQVVEQGEAPKRETGGPVNHGRAIMLSRP